MTVAVLYLIAVVYVFFSTGGHCTLNGTNILLASGIIGVCACLREIKDAIGKNNHA